MSHHVEGLLEMVPLNQLSTILCSASNWQIKPTQVSTQVKNAEYMPTSALKWGRFGSASNMCAHAVIFQCVPSIQIEASQRVSGACAKRKTSPPTPTYPPTLRGKGQGWSTLAPPTQPTSHSRPVVRHVLMKKWALSIFSLDY